MIGGLEVTTATGTPTMIEATDVATFQASLRGKVLSRSDAGYDDHGRRTSGRGYFQTSDHMLSPLSTAWQ